MDHPKLMDKRGAALSPFTATGGALSVAAGRVSFTHGLTGPAVSVDTACSSSLVAIQSAYAADRAAGASGAAAAEQTGSGPGSRGALVAGVNLLQIPETTMMFQRAGMITPDGRCKVRRCRLTPR